MELSKVIETGEIWNNWRYHRYNDNIVNIEKKG